MKVMDDLIVSYGLSQHQACHIRLVINQIEYEHESTCIYYLLTLAGLKMETTMDFGTESFNSSVRSEKVWDEWMQN